MSNHHSRNRGHGHGHGAHHHHHAPSRGVLGRTVELLRPHSHDGADSIDGALEASAEGIRAVKISLVALSATALAQVAVVIMSGSVALLADTIHNASDALTALPLWLAFTLARRPATRRYTYGFGRAEDLAGVVILVTIAASTLLAGLQSLNRLLHPTTVTHIGIVAIAGLIGSPATNWSPSTASAPGAGSAQPPWSPTDTTPASTDSPPSPSSSEPAASRSDGVGPTRSSAS